ncbi:hypothetical protein PHYBOEH_007764 [Phytophthora boehmeriae]|uniref:Cytochrome P450 n=1 Tax=Phytophthora boehmeriae TaxID=109152 RepID=A0A8T1W993_9STRA|nr:hypothetical protein PHYBOEH_007764 [Phytophthora boehmeriae]
MTAAQPTEGSPAFSDWLVATTKTFHGKPWLLHVSGRPHALVLSSPQLFEDVQRTFALQFEKVDSQFDTAGFDVHGGGVASVSGSCLRPPMQIQRHLAAAVLTSPILREQASKLVAKHVESLVKVLEDAAGDDKSQPRSPLDVTKLMRRFAMEVFVELGFGLQLGALSSSSEDSSAFEKAVDQVQALMPRRASRSALAWKLERLLRVGDEATLSRSAAFVETEILAAVEAKSKKRRGDSGCGSPLASGAGHVDMLDVIMKQKRNSRSIKDPGFLAEFVLGLVVAARDSMAYTLSMCLHCLAQHPEEQEKLYEELCKAEESGKPHSSLVRLEAVVKETMRLFPTKPFVRRRAKTDVILSDNTFVAAKTEVAMDIYGMARSETVWGLGGAEFRPQRWIDVKTGNLRPASTYKFNAFLGGPQACLGAEIALTEIKTILAVLINKVRFSPVDNETSCCNEETPVRSNGAVMVQIHRRRPSPPGQYS